MKWMLILTLASVLLVGCGGSSATGATSSGSAAPGTATTPEQVHTAWVEAMKNNDRATLLNLAAEMDFKTAFVDDNLRSLQDKLRGTTEGKLQSVDVRAPTDDGAGKSGMSVWRFEQHTSCYQTVLTSENGVWKVTSWGVMRRCPADVQ